MDLTFRNSPRISRQQFSGILTQRNSPVAPVADACYDICVRAGIDPAIALAFFAKESTFGTAGVSVEAKNWGNVRTPHKPELARGTVTSPRGTGEYAKYDTWQDGLTDWCARINEKYIGQWGLDTVAKALPKYAPSSDGNDTQLYINQVCEWVTSWQNTDPAPVGAAPAAAPVGDQAAELRNSLIRETFAVHGNEYQAELSFHQYALAEAAAGRPLGAPQAPPKQVTIGGQQYSLQVFALDTLYAATPNLSDVQRMSALLK